MPALISTLIPPALARHPESAHTPPVLPFARAGAPGRRSPPPGRLASPAAWATLSSFSFLRRHSSHSLAIRPHRIHVSSSRWLRLEEAEELDTSEEPLFRREPFMERMDLESASRSLGMAGGEGGGCRSFPPWPLGPKEPGPPSLGSQRIPGIGSKLFFLSGTC